MITSYFEVTVTLPGLRGPSYAVNRYTENRSFHLARKTNGVGRSGFLRPFCRYHRPSERRL